VEDDLERALTPKGERQAQRMAHWLNHVLPATTRILVSLARRAQPTAKALDRRFKTVDALAPEAGVPALRSPDMP
jgi:phosphohistidine phosphatase